MSTTNRLFAKYYFSRPGYVGGTQQFHELCGRYIASGSKILEIGAGPRNATSDYLATLGTVTGVDLTNEIAGNTALTEYHLYDGATLPFAADSFDACVSNYVVEHVQDPERHFMEVSRVLRPGGSYLFRTPNMYHYVTTASRLLPHSLHRAWANRLRVLATDAHEPWPTVYRANTKRAIMSLAKRTGLRLAHCELSEKEPSYGRASVMLFYPMLAYERIVNATTRLEMFRSNFFVALTKLAR